MSFNYYVRDPAGTSIPVSLKMKQDCWLSTPRSLTFVADLWPATSVIMSLLVLPFSSDRRSYQSVLGAYIHVYLSLSCNENTWCFTILQGEQKEKTKKKKPQNQWLQSKGAMVVLSLTCTGKKQIYLAVDTLSDAYRILQNFSCPITSRLQIVKSINWTSFRISTPGP